MAGASDSRTNSLLLAAVRDLRDERAWSAFCQRYEALIRACCLKQGLRPAAADELTHAVLVKLVEAMPGFKYDRRGRFRSWLRTLVRNAVADSRPVGVIYQAGARVRARIEQALVRPRRAAAARRRQGGTMANARSSADLNPDR
jgi:hypothetical protein